MKMDEAWWSDRYKTGYTEWDAGGITTPLKEYFLQLHRKDLAILIPGCGNSHEAEFLVNQGFTNVTVLDISSVLCETLEKKFSSHPGKHLQVVCADFFTHAGAYDLIVEQTFFCALDPGLRPNYVEQVFKLLKPEGKLVGVLFDADFNEGPPFGGNKNLYTDLFKDLFRIRVMERCYNSIKPRMERELFINLQKRSIH